jgi:hypothetical protein
MLREDIDDPFAVTPKDLNVALWTKALVVVVELASRTLAKAESKMRVEVNIVLYCQMLFLLLEWRGKCGSIDLIDHQHKKCQETY